MLRALKETQCAAIVRYVYRDGLNPKLGALLPHISTNTEGLIFQQLPFAEDIRNYTFPSLLV